MINKLSYLVTQCVDPYSNIALEEELLSVVAPDECILYLWQNEQTVVIGRNQNCRGECRVSELEADGGHLARRLSGGGAVYHDRGNLNFTFVVNKDNYSIERQTEVILCAAVNLGISATRTGRNDIAVDGRKFSGNAFYSRGNSKYHHGTLLVNADIGKLSQYLTVSQDKLQAHGVRSVTSRVVNLGELVEGLTIERVATAMISAFGKVYGGTPEALDSGRLDSRRLARGRDKFASWEWRIGSDPKFTCSLRHRFAWGSVEIGLLVQGGKVAQATVYTDALYDELSAIVEGALVFARFAPDELLRALHSVYGKSVETTSMVRDIATIVEEFFV